MIDKGLLIQICFAIVGLVGQIAIQLETRKYALAFIFACTMITIGITINLLT